SKLHIKIRVFFFMGPLLVWAPGKSLQHSRPLCSTVHNCFGNFQLSIEGLLSLSRRGDATLKADDSGKNIDLEAVFGFGNININGHFKYKVCITFSIMYMTNFKMNF